MNNAKPERDQDIAVRCFMSLLRWLRVVLLQDAVFLRGKYPALNIWLKPPFNSSMFENFAQQLLHEAEHEETPQYVRVSRAMPDLAHQLREQYENLMNAIVMHQQFILAQNQQEHVAASNSNREEHILTRDTVLYNFQPIVSLLNHLSNSGLTFHTDTRVQLTDSSYIVNITTGAPLIGLDSATTMNSMSQSLVNEERVVPSSISESNSIEQYRLASHVNTVVEL